MELRLIFALACILYIQVVFAGVDEYRFDDPSYQARFYKLAGEYKCLGCQDGSLLETSSLNAVDLRTQIYRMIASGKSDREIRNYLVYRYGEHVMYRSPTAYSSWALWLTPIGLLLIVGSFLLWFYRCVRV